MDISSPIYLLPKLVDFVAGVNKKKHGTTGPQNQSLPNAGKKCLLARPITTQNFVAIQQEVSVIAISKQ